MSDRERPIGQSVQVEASITTRAAMISARALLELADHFGRNVGSDRVVVQHKIGQSDLAAMTGIARENLSRILKDWERRKIVSCLSGYYCLEDSSVRLKLE